MRQALFDASIHLTGRALVARDLLLGRIKPHWRIAPKERGARRLAIESGANVLDAVLVEPAAQPARAAVLICHGIGETVQHWYRVQQLLAAGGVASLVFDYSGYGHSTGRFRARQSERDAESAFRAFQRLVAPLPVSLLGFSLGSGIAAAILPRVPARSLLLCAAFPSLRAAARSVGVFGLLEFATPAIWNSADALRACAVPVHIVHGSRDRLFPVSMAAALRDACKSPVELILAPGVGHNEPYHRPQLSYWGPILSRLVDPSAQAHSAESGGGG